MLRLAVVGGGHQIGSSCYVVNEELAVDCGLNPRIAAQNESLEAKEEEVFSEEELPNLDSPLLKKAKVLFLTHAHLDHTGGAPAIVRKYDIKKVICSEITYELTIGLLEDSLRIAKKRQNKKIAFSSSDLDRFKSRIQIIGLDQKINLDNGLEIETISAGHIDGSYSLKFFKDGKVGLLTSDVCFRRQEFIPRAPFFKEKLDLLVTETTYAGSEPRNKIKEKKELLNALEQGVKENKKILLPCFSVGKSQQLFWLIKKHFGDNFPLYIDGASRDILKLLGDFYDYESRTLRKYLVHNKYFRYKILEKGRPAVIISSSGMLIGGMSNFYTSRLLNRDDACIFFTGYLDPDSPGWEIANAWRGKQIEFEGRHLAMLADVRRFYISSHVSETEIMNLVLRTKPELTVLVHGYPKGMGHLIERLKKKEFKKPIEIGYNGRIFEV